MKRKLLIIGASGHGKVVLDIALCMDKYEEIAFLDDNDSIKEIMGYPAVGSSDQISKYINDSDFFVAIGNGEIRRKIYEKIKDAGGTVVTLIHPQAIIGQDVKIGEGTVVMAGTVINPGTIIGRCCIINTSSSVDHDCHISDFVHISVGAHVAGTVKIGTDTWIGVGAIVSNNVVICENCMVGAGGVVTKDILNPGVYIGVPVKEIGMEKVNRYRGGKSIHRK